MCRQIITTGPVTLFLVMLSSTLTAADEGRLLFDFTGPDAAKAWVNVNDGVMGGVSDGRCRITDNKTMEFFGTLSL